MERFKELRKEYYQKLIDEIIKPQLPLELECYTIVDVYDSGHGVFVVKRYPGGRETRDCLDPHFGDLEAECWLYFLP